MKKKKRTKICRVCGTEFTVREHRNGQRICDDCLERLGHEWKEWQNGRYQQRKSCLICGAELQPRTPDLHWMRKGCCSEECKSLLVSVRDAYKAKAEKQSYETKPKSRLDVDIAAEREAGMSYGLYMVEKRRRQL